MSSFRFNSPHCRRGSQATRLADELRGTALGLASSSSLFADAGAQLVADALAERPPPRDYTTTTGKTTGVFRRRSAKASEPPQAGAGNLVTNHSSSMQSEGARLLAIRAGVVVATDGGSSNSSGSDYSAIEVAARKEERTASARISDFLWRRRQERLVDDDDDVDVPETKDDAVLATASMVPATAELPSSGGVAGWLGAAVVALRQAIDSFLPGERTTEDPNKLLADGKTNPEDDHNTAAEGTIPSRGSDAGRGTTGRRRKLDGLNGDCTNSDGDDDSSTTFSQVPLRARVPSLYTLPPPGGSWGAATRTGGDGGGDDGARSTTSNTISGGLFTKLDPAVAARLYSARSVFALRAADVLAVFSPPPPPPPPSPLSPFASSARGNLFRPSTAPPAAAATGSGGRHSRKLSSDALRQHLHTEAEDASRTGLGRPWGLPKWPFPAGGSSGSGRGSGSSSGSGSGGGSGRGGGFTPWSVFSRGRFACRRSASVLLPFVIVF